MPPEPMPASPSHLRLAGSSTSARAGRTGGTDLFRAFCSRKRDRSSVSHERHHTLCLGEVPQGPLPLTITPRALSSPPPESRCQLGT